MMKLIFLFLNFSILINLFGQETPNYSSTKEEINTYLKSMSADKIEFQGEESYQYKLRDKKTKKWGLYDDGIERIAPKYDSVGFSENDFESEFMIVKNDEKYGVFVLHASDSKQKVHCKFHRIVIVMHDDYSGSNFVLVSNGKKWGLYEPIINFQAIPFYYENKENVPLFRVDDWIYEYMKKVQKKTDANFFLMDGGNGDGVFKARSAVSGKWGMYQMENTLIPMKYDSIDFIGFNAPFTFVWNKGKLGVYSELFGEPKLTTPCIYQNGKIVVYNGSYYFAASKDDKWGWVDWYTGEVQMAFEYDSYDDLTSPTQFTSEYYNW